MGRYKGFLERKVDERNKMLNDIANWQGTANVGTQLKPNKSRKTGGKKIILK